MLILFPKFIYYFVNFVLLMAAKSVVHKKMHLKQMYMSMIEPATVMHSSIVDYDMSLPYAPIASDIHSCENLIHLHYMIKKFDSNFWARAEIFSSVIFGIFSLQLAYIAL